MADTLTINGSSINLTTTNTTIDRCTPYAKGGMPELHFSRLVGKLAALPDTWSGQTVTLTMGATLVFSGDVVGYVDQYIDGFGWLREYRALGLVNRGNYIPLTDSTSLTDTSTWNIPGDDPQFVGARAGQTVGQIVGQILTMGTNATPLYNAGIGNYTSLSPWTLPALTVADLATLSIIPPWRVTVSGERILQGLEAFVQSCHPNHFLHVQPDGTIRFLDVRTFTPATVTLGNAADPRFTMPSLTRDYSDSYSQVEVRGNTLVEGVYLQTKKWPGSSNADGGLAEDFAWNGFTNAQAKTNWTSACWSQPYANGVAADTGTCTCPSTTVMRVTSSDNTKTWTANYWGQANGESLGVVFAYAESLGGMVSQFVSRRIVANTALAAAGTSDLTLDSPLPSTGFTSYAIWGLAANCNLVGRKYKVTNAAIGAAMQQLFPYPFAFRNAAGTGAAMTITPIAQIMYSASGNPPYTVGTCGVTLDPTSGHIYMSQPVQTILGSGVWPSNVNVFVPVAVGTMNAYAPSSSTYAGTLFSVEGIRRTKIITVQEWRDYSNTTTMATFASEFLDSVKDVVVEGTLPYLGLNTTYLAPGQSISITGSSYTTGWESLALPVVSADIIFQQGPQGGTSYTMALHLSNRRGRISASNFLRPNMTPMSLSDGGSIVVGPVTGLQGAPGFTGAGGFASGADMPIAAPITSVPSGMEAPKMGDPGFEDMTTARGVQNNAATPADFYGGMGLGASAMEQTQAGYAGVQQTQGAINQGMADLGQMYRDSTAGIDLTQRAPAPPREQHSAPAGQINPTAMQAISANEMGPGYPTEVLADNSHQATTRDTRDQAARKTQSNKDLQARIDRATPPHPDPIQPDLPGDVLVAE
jgi:hypothetical protein